ncbi:hypothetical protein [Bacteroides caccae]|uniref:hypothetical protein n=1 Tax=Bacteroides caccae TaxID=47678 RepID=UPI0022E249A7|nr:hypothetical protein [Bacteroides caccae]
MAKYDVKVRYSFEGTYTVAAEDREEAKRMVSEDCGLVLGGNIHTTRDDDEVTDWDFSIHPDTQVLSIKQKDAKSAMSVFGDRIEELRKDIIEAIRQLLHDHAMNAIKESGDEVECYSPFELGASNIDWLSGMYEAVWRQLEDSEKVEPQTEEQ